MTNTVPEHEHGLVRVFHFTPDPDQPDSGELTDFARSLGVTELDAGQIQRVVISDLGDLTLSGFLANGYSIAPDQISDHKAALDALEGVGFVVRSSAFTTRPATFKTDDMVKLVATLAEPGADVRFEPLPDAGAARTEVQTPAKKKPSDAAMSGRVATVALLVMAFLVWLMIKIAG